jgi:hypothetical protein
VKRSDSFAHPVSLAGRRRLNPEPEEAERSLNEYGTAELKNSCGPNHRAHIRREMPPFKCKADMDES